MERVTAAYFSRAAHFTDGLYIIDMSLLIIAQLLLLRAVDSFKVSRRRHARRR
jgi:hypothetical protein